ncbi:unnamed protein product [Pelagomonas calceolata]|uniref:Uncharacterized protein n=1 Tax=Pelagomonas calceolata TaxID=35677 RepID=A0A8J2X0S2_9STRA|nr:unnamed protein product [Pelagomonas calceolata]
MQGHHALYCAAPAHATGRLGTAGSGARGRRHILAALLMACGHAKTAVLVHGFHLRAPNWETVVWGGGGGRVAYGYDLAIIRAKSADGAGAETHRFRTGQSGGGGPVRGGLGRVDGRGDGRDRGCRHLTTPAGRKLPSVLRRAHKRRGRPRRRPQHAGGARALLGAVPRAWRGARLLRELAGALSPRLPRRRGRVRGAAPDLPLGGGAVPHGLLSGVRRRDRRAAAPAGSRAAAPARRRQPRLPPSAGGPGGVRRPRGRVSRRR